MYSICILLCSQSVSQSVSQSIRAYSPLPTLCISFQEVVLSVSVVVVVVVVWCCPLPSVRVASEVGGLVTHVKLVGSFILQVYFLAHALPGPMMLCSTYLPTYLPTHNPESMRCRFSSPIRCQLGCSASTQ